MKFIDANEYLENKSRKAIDDVANQTRELEVNSIISTLKHYNVTKANASNYAKQLSKDLNGGQLNPKELSFVLSSL